VLNHPRVFLGNKVKKRVIKITSNPGRSQGEPPKLVEYKGRNFLTKKAIGQKRDTVWAVRGVVGTFDVVINHGFGDGLKTLLNPRSVIKITFNGLIRWVILLPELPPKTSSNKGKLLRD
jgi:hypothetical protein